MIPAPSDSGLSGKWSLYLSHACSYEHYSTGWGDHLHPGLSLLAPKRLVVIGTLIYFPLSFAIVIPRAECGGGDYPRHVLKGIAKTPVKVPRFLLKGERSVLCNPFI